MDSTAALVAGLTVGLVIAMQFGAVSLLLVEASVARGPRAGMAAGMGVATADLVFAAIAAAAGGAAGAVLSAHEAQMRLVAAAVLAAIAVTGLVSVLREGPPEEEKGMESPGGKASGHYARFLAITAANPLTIVSFAAVAAALSLDGALAASAFVLGVGAASAAWHLVLTLAAGHAGRWLTPRARRGLAVAGRLGVLAIATHLALGA